jgi:hypothetical protein
MMTGQQTIALMHPCYLACETIHPRFRKVQNGVSCIVTINAGYE